LNQSKLLLRVKNLAVHFPSDGKIIKAVDEISFEIDEGETVAFVGESGSGKSVTALSIVRLIDPPGKIVNGEILWKDEIDLLKVDEDTMRKIRGREISIIFQDVSNSLNPVLSVGQQVAEVFTSHFMMNKKEARKKVFELFEKIGIREPGKIFDLYPHQLSGGLKQRILIAIAFALKPKLVIADEPTSSIDALTQYQILELFNSLQKEYKTSILLITHNFGIVTKISKRVYVMHKGKIVESGDTSVVLSKPSHPYTIKLIESAKFLSL
jgi:ABC-type dipeptide/oligopeptide/nickel transport system ATPase component